MDWPSKFTVKHRNAIRTATGWDAADVGVAGGDQGNPNGPIVFPEWIKLHTDFDLLCSVLFFWKNPGFEGEGEDAKAATEEFSEAFSGGEISEGFEALEVAVADFSKGLHRSDLFGVTMAKAREVGQAMEKVVIAQLNAADVTRLSQSPLATGGEKSGDSQESRE